MQNTKYKILFFIVVSFFNTITMDKSFSLRQTELQKPLFEETVGSLYFFDDISFTKVYRKGKYTYALTNQALYQQKELKKNSICFSVHNQSNKEKYSLQDIAIINQNTIALQTKQNIVILNSKNINQVATFSEEDYVNFQFHSLFSLPTTNELLKIIKVHEGAGLVIGWPLLQDGTPGKRCQSVKDFAAELGRFLGGQEYDILMTFWDERFSTQKGDQVIEDIGKTAGKRIRSARRDQIIDSLAAQHILQDFMDTHMTTSSMY